MTLLDAALSYAGRGWRVFPLEPRGKVPLGALAPHGVLDATTDPATVRRWWTEQPAANIGIATGAASGIDVLDLDVPKGDQPGGLAALVRLEAKHGAVPTLTSATGGGGQHRVFLHHPGMRNSAGRLPGIDVRGDGGYIVAPPSVHPSGTVYRWIVDPDSTAAAAWPAYLLDALAKKAPPTAPPRKRSAPGTSTPYGETALGGMVAELASAPAGTRDDLRNRLAFRAGQLVAAEHLSHDGAAADLFGACQRNGLVAEHGESEIRKRIERGLADGIAAGPTGPEVGPRQRAADSESADCADAPAEGWVAPTPLDSRRVRDFPVEVFPPDWGQWIATEAEATQTPLALPACVALAVLAVAAARAGYVVVPRPGWREPINLYVLVVLPPANRKSPVFAAAAGPLLEWERDAGIQQQSLIARAAAERDVLEKKLDKAKKSAAAGTDPLAMDEVARLADEVSRHEVPVQTRLFADDVTPERLGAMLAEQRGVFALLSSEGGIFETIGGRYSDGVPNMDVFLKGHAADALRVDRGSRPPVSVDRPMLTMGLTAQPDVLVGLTRKPGFRGRGLLARFLFALPVSPVGSRRVAPQPVPEAVAVAFRQAVRRLLDKGPIQLQAAGPVERPLTLTPAAAARLLALERGVEGRLGADGDLSGIQDWAGKYVGTVVRLAGLLHVAEDDGTLVISETTFERAERAGVFFLDHALAAFDAMGADVPMEGARIILRCIRRHRWETFGHRQLFNKVRGSAELRTVEGLEASLDLLVELGWLRRVPAQERAGPGRRPRETYVVNPLGELYAQNAQSGGSGDSAHCAYGSVEVDPAHPDHGADSDDENGAPVGVGGGR